MLIRRLGILCYLLLAPSKVVAVFKELIRLLMLWFLQRNSPNVFYQFSFLQTRKKSNKLLFLFMALIWNRHLCEHCFLLFLNKTCTLLYKAGLSDHWDWESSWCAAGKSLGNESRSRELFSSLWSCVCRVSVLTLLRQGLEKFALLLLPLLARQPILLSFRNWEIMS